MDKLHLNIISPEQLLFSGEVESVCLPGTGGLFSILPHHAPIVSSLGPGQVTYVDEGEEHVISIQSGFVELSSNVVDVCIENAMDAQNETKVYEKNI